MRGFPYLRQSFRRWHRCRRVVLFFWLCLFGMSSSPLSADNLNLFIWSEYIDPQVVAQFEKETGSKVIIDLFEDDAGMVSKLRNGGASQYDVVVAPDHTIPKLAKLELIRPLPRERVHALTNIDVKFLAPPYDPKNTYSVPYLWGTVCLYARVSPTHPVPATWGVFFDPKQQVGPFLLMDGMRDLIGAALKYKGYSLNTTDPRQLKEVRDLLIECKKRSVGFEGGVGGKNKVLGKSVQVAMAYSGDALRGTREDKETVCLIPAEGTQIWVDNLVICSSAPHPELAGRFIEFMLRPEISAKLANVLQYATPNRAARDLVDPAMVKNPAIYPPSEVMGKLEFLKDLGRETRLYDEIWTQIRSR